MSGAMDNPIIGGPTHDPALGVDYGALYLHEFGYSENGAPRAPAGMVYAESGNITLGPGDTRYHVRQIILDAEGDPDMLGYRFALREQPQSEEHDTGLYTVRHDGLLDVRFSGRHIRMRMEALKDGPFAVGRPYLQIRKGGRR